MAEGTTDIPRIDDQDPDFSADTTYGEIESFYECLEHVTPHLAYEQI